MTIASSKLVRCSYPNCVLEEHLEGEHKLGRPDKPWGTLRQLQSACLVFQRGLGRCDLHFESWAVAFYADMLGFGWALCAECARAFTATDAKIAKEEQAAVSLAQLSVAPVATSVVNLPTKFLKFEPAAKSQKLKAGVS